MTMLGKTRKYPQPVWAFVKFPSILMPGWPAPPSVPAHFQLMTVSWVCSSLFHFWVPGLDYPGTERLCSGLTWCCCTPSWDLEAELISGHPGVWKSVRLWRCPRWSGWSWGPGRTSTSSWKRLLEHDKFKLHAALTLLFDLAVGSPVFATCSQCAWLG